MIANRPAAFMLVAGITFMMADRLAIAADTARARRADEHRENKAVKNALESVEESERLVRECRQSLQRSQATYRQAQSERIRAAISLEKATDALEANHSESASIRAARVTLNDARTRLREASEPILESIRSLPAYKSAEEERAAALILLEPEAEADREDAARRVNAAAATMREMERSATDAEPNLAALEVEVAAAQSRFEAARHRFEKAVEQDPALKAARRLFESARAAELKAESALVRDNRDLITANARLARSEQGLSSKRAADRNDVNKPPTKNKSPRNDRTQ